MQHQQQQQYSNHMYQSPPIQIQSHTQAPSQNLPPSHNNTTVNTPQLIASYAAATPPNSNIMNTSSFSPITNTYFSPSFNSISSGYLNQNQNQNQPNQSPQMKPQQSPLSSISNMNMNMNMNMNSNGISNNNMNGISNSISNMNGISNSNAISNSNGISNSNAISMPLQMPLQYQNNMSAGISAVLGQSIKTFKIYRPYFQLEMYVPRIEHVDAAAAAAANVENGAFSTATTASSLRTMYETHVAEHNKTVFPTIVGTPGEYNAGFDLLAPSRMTAYGFNQIKIDHLVKCRMTKIIPHSSHPINMFQDANGILRQYNASVVPVAFYLYPRSSTGTKTPLRLANSVGIIDSGYRGPLIAAFDNGNEDDFEIQDKQRLVQICAPDLSYPIYVILVDSEEELGKTNRGSGGFGSTG